jgi:hypothetical protein
VCTEDTDAYAQHAHKKLYIIYILTPKSTGEEKALWYKNHENPAIENLTLGKSYSNCKKSLFFSAVGFIK